MVASYICKNSHEYKQIKVNNHKLEYISEGGDINVTLFETTSILWLPEGSLGMPPNITRWPRPNNSEYKRHGSGGQPK